MEIGVRVTIFTFAFSDPDPRIYSSCLKSLINLEPFIIVSAIMETIILSVFVCVVLISRDKNLLLESLALRQQLAIMKQHFKRPKIRIKDRIFWVVFSGLWKDWKNVLIVVKPETVIRWHRKGFKLFWQFKSRKRLVGRPSLDPEIRRLIQDMARVNPLWGTPRIHGELMKLGIDVHERTVSKIIKRFRPRKPPSHTWRTFLKNHMFNTFFAIDFFTVPTATLDILYVFVIILHESSRDSRFVSTPSFQSMSQFPSTFLYQTNPTIQYQLT